MNVAYFTAATVGAGHLLRALSIERGLKRAGFEGTYRMIGPNPVLPDRLVPPNWRVVQIRHEEIAVPERAWETEIARELFDFEPDLLLVDIFWAPLLHILPVLNKPAWLIAGSMPSFWLQGPSHHPFDPEQYERIIAVEPFLNLPVTDSVEPIVIVNPDERRPPEAIRKRYGVEPGQKLTVVVQAGLAGEAQELARREGDGDSVLAVLSLHDPEPLFPSAPWLTGADRIVSGAGYNVFWESKWLGHYDRTVFFPFPRTVDDHAWRLSACSGVVMTANGADTLAGWILKG